MFSRVPALPWSSHRQLRAPSLHGASLTSNKSITLGTGQSWAGFSPSSVCLFIFMHWEMQVFIKERRLYKVCFSEGRAPTNPGHPLCPAVPWLSPAPRGPPRTPINKAALISPPRGGQGTVMEVLAQAAMTLTVQNYTLFWPN